MESKQKYKQHDIFSLLLDTYVDGKNLAPVTKMAQTKKKNSRYSYTLITRAHLTTVMLSHS